MTSNEYLTWCDDLHQVKGNISQLQATLNHVLAKAPTASQYKQLMATTDNGSSETPSNQQVLDKLRTSLNSPQIKVAVRLRSLYEKGFLPFWLALARINFKSPRADRFVGYLLDYQPLKKDVNSIVQENDNTKKIGLQDDLAPFPPSLPPLADSLLHRLVLTDKSLRQPLDYLELQTKTGHHDFNNNHNRKLAILGGKLLDLALVDVLDEEFPKAHENDIDYLRYRLTNSHILARLAYCYNLTEAVFHNVSVELATLDKLVIFKNVFLAYVGAMSKSEYSYAEIKFWVKKLYMPLITRLHEDLTSDEKLQNPYEIAHSEFRFLIDRVNGYLDQPKKKIKYEFNFSLEECPYVCRLVVGPLELGIGTGRCYTAAKKMAVFATFEDAELRTQLLEFLIESYAPEKPKQESGDEQVALQQQQRDLSNGDAQKEPESEDEAYSPEVNGDDYEPATAPTVTSAPEVNISAIPTGPAAAPSATATQATATPAPAHQARMPLPYGALPPIPSMKKRGPAWR